MKKTISLLTALMMLISLCACGASKDDAKASKDEAAPLIDFVDETADPVALRADYDKAIAYANSLIDKTDMTESDQDDQGGTSLYHYWSYDAETENADFPMDITLDGTKISLGATKVSALRDAGMTLSISEETVEPDTTFGFSVEKEPYAFTNLSAANTTGKTANIYTLPITDITVMTDESGIPFSYSGLAKGTDLQAVIDTFGTPNYNITLSSDIIGTAFTLDYFHDEGNISDSMSIYMMYDPATNKATLASLTLARTYLDE